MVARKPVVIGSSGDYSEVALPTDWLDNPLNYTSTWGAGDIPHGWSAIDSYHVPKNRAVSKVASDQVVSGTTLVGVTGLIITLPRAGTYDVHATMICAQTSAAGTFGCGFSISGGGTPSICVAGLIWNAATTAPAQRTQLAFPPTAMTGGATAAAGVTFLAQIFGTVTVTTSGFLTLGAQRSAGTCTVKTGSVLQAWEI